MVNISFGDRKSYDDWGLMLEHIDISFPQAKQEKISVPGMDGVLDLTEIHGDIKYEERRIEFKFSLMCNDCNWHMRASEIANYLHGQKLRIVLDSDPAFYYEGRMELKYAKDNDVIEDVWIGGDVDPYKYDIEDGSTPWIWDRFSFKNGIIRNYSDIVIDGTGIVTIAGRRKKAFPEITCSAPMLLTYDNMSMNLPTGSTKVYELQLGEGEHLLRFSGKGTVTVSYRGGSL